MKRTPIMCHQAENAFSAAVSGTLSMFTRPAASMMNDVGQVDPVVRVAVAAVRDQVEPRRHEDRAAEADRGCHGDLPDEVEPAGEPAPGRGCRASTTSSTGRPRSDRSRRSRPAPARRSAEAADEQPAPRDRDRAALVEADRVRGEAPGEDRDDREGDGEVLETAHRAEQLLGVAEPV